MTCTSKPSLPVRPNSVYAEAPSGQIRVTLQSGARYMSSQALIGARHCQYTQIVHLAAP